MKTLLIVGSFFVLTASTLLIASSTTSTERGPNTCLTCGYPTQLCKCE